MNIDQLHELLAIYSTSDPAGGRAFRQNTTEASRLAQIKSFNDVVVAITYNDQGTADERFNTVTYSSVSSTLAPVVLTMAYTGGPGTYSLLTITYS